MDKIAIQFTLFSAFYSPLIATMAGGFLKEEGLDASWSVAPPGVSAIKALEAGEAHVIQSAPSQAISGMITSDDSAPPPTRLTHRPCRGCSVPKRR